VSLSIARNSLSETAAIGLHRKRYNCTIDLKGEA